METDVEETIGGGQVGCWWGAGGRRGSCSAGWACAAAAATTTSSAGNVFKFSAGAGSIGVAISAATSPVSGAGGEYVSHILLFA